MTQAGVLKFIIIDDDSINNFLVKIILKKLTVNSNVESFTDSDVSHFASFTSLCSFAMILSFSIFALSTESRRERIDEISA